MPPMIFVVGSEGSVQVMMREKEGCGEGMRMEA